MIAVTIICAVLVPVALSYGVGYFYGAREDLRNRIPKSFLAIDVFALAAVVCLFFSICAAELIARLSTDGTGDQALSDHTVFFVYSSSWGIGAVVFIGMVLCAVGHQRGLRAQGDVA